MPSLKKLPNILWLGADSLPRRVIGAYGLSDCRTPQIDRLAEAGVVFDRAYCPTAVCAPARAAIMTGRLPSEGATTSNNPMEWMLPLKRIGPLINMPTWAPHLLAAGYEAAHIGKWHLTPDEDDSPRRYGFKGGFPGGYGNHFYLQEFRRYMTAKGLPIQPDYDAVMLPKHPIPSPFEPIAARLKGPPEVSVDAFLAESALKHLDRLVRRCKKTGRPFFLRIEFWGPHIRCLVPEPYFSMYRPEKLELPENFGILGKNKPRIHSLFSGYWGIASLPVAQQRKFIAIFMGYVSLIDAQIGRILAALEESGLYDDTLTIFTADHGDMLGSHRLYDKGPFMYEEIYRVPLVIRWPRIAEPARNESLVYNMDMAATLWDLLDRPFRGGSSRSLMPILKGRAAHVGREAIICEFYRQCDFYPQAMVHTGLEKYVYNFGDIDEYYNLESDPCELENLVAQKEMYPKIRALRHRLYQWMKKVNSPMREGLERSWINKQYH